MSFQPLPPAITINTDKKWCVYALLVEISSNAALSRGFLHNSLQCHVGHRSVLSEHQRCELIPPRNHTRVMGSFPSYRCDDKTKDNKIKIV